MEDYGILQEGISAVSIHLETLGYSEGVKGRYIKAYEDISHYFEIIEAACYSSETTLRYREDIQNRFRSGSLSIKKYNLFTRLSFMMDSFYAGEPFSMKYSRGLRYKVCLDDYYQSRVDAFESYLEDKVSSVSIPGFVTIGRDFFHYLQARGIKSPEDIVDNDIVRFMQEEHKSHPASMNNVCCAVRQIVRFLEPEGCRINEKVISYKAAPTRRQIYPALEEDELQAILETPDRNTPMGKRDYAVLLLASFTGLRAIDIANFKFESYDREKRTIRIIQHKTGHPVGLPIPCEVVEAIDDYVNNGRPVCDNPYVFLTVDKPTRKLSDTSSIRNILIRQLKRSGLGTMPGKGRGFHAFRRTIGKWLLGASVDPEMISQVLGHGDGEVLKRYLPLSADLMRECALSLEEAPLRSEVYA